MLQLIQQTKDIFIAFGWIYLSALGNNTSPAAIGQPGGGMLTRQHGID